MTMRCNGRELILYCRNNPVLTVHGVLCGHAPATTFFPHRFNQATRYMQWRSQPENPVRSECIYGVRMHT
jgi:hypothetical protein